MLIFFSDSHLSRYIWRDRIQITGDAYSALHQIADIAIDNRAAAVIAAGDIFDNRSPTSEDVWHFRRFCDRLWHAGVGLFYIDGQHDWSEPSWPESIHPHAVNIDRRCILIDNRSIYGLSHVKKRDLEDALASVPEECEILVAHQLWAELLGTGPVAADASVESIPHARMLYSGDMHKCTTYQGTNAQGYKVVAISSGATRLCRLGEPHQHQVLSLEGNDLRFIALQSRPVVEVSVGPSLDKSELEKAADQLRDEKVPADEWCDYKGILVVRISGESSDNLFHKVGVWAQQVEDLHVIRVVEASQRVASNPIRPAAVSVHTNKFEIARKFIEADFSARGNTDDVSLKNCMRLAEAALRSRQDAVKTIDQIRSEYLS